MIKHYFMIGPGVQAAHGGGGVRPEIGLAVPVIQYCSILCVMCDHIILYCIMYVCIYIYIERERERHIHIRIYAYTHIHIYTSTHIYTHIHIYTYIYTYTHIHISHIIII